MADAIITDVVQDVSRNLTASNVMVEKFDIYEDDGPTREHISSRMKYHQCKADSREGGLDKPQVDGYVERKWSLSGGDDLKELVSTVVESTNVKAIYVSRDCRPYTYDVIEQLLQGLYTNYTIMSAVFCIFSLWNTMIDAMDKFVVMLCHNIGLKHFIFDLPSTIEGRKFHSGFGNALRMNHTLEHLQLYFPSNSVELDLEELVQPLFMDENGHQANSTLTTLCVMGLSAMSSVGATFARMLQKFFSIKHLDLTISLTSESDVQTLIRSLVENHSIETLDLFGCDGVKGSVFPTIIDVLLVNFTLKNIILCHTPLRREGKHLAIKQQVRRNGMYKVLHLKELEMAKPTFARVIFCSSPYAGMS